MSAALINKHCHTESNATLSITGSWFDSAPWADWCASLTSLTLTDVQRLSTRLSVLPRTVELDRAAALFESDVYAPLASPMALTSVFTVAMTRMLHLLCGKSTATPSKSEADEVL
jgi:hypothetical protein